MPKLPVVQTVTEVWKYIWQERRDLFFLAAPFVVILSIANTILIGAIPESPVAGEAAVVSPAFRLALPLQIILGLIVTTLFSVTWHRRYLLPEVSLTVAATLNWTQRHWRFLRAMLVFFGIYMALIMAFSVIFSVLVLLLRSSGDPTQAPVLLAAAFPILIYCLARLSLLFPAAAVDERLSVKACWQRTQGNGWRIFFIYLLASLPLILLVMAVSAVLAFLLPAPDAPITVIFLSGLIQQMLFYFSFAVGVTVLSHVYAILTPRPASPTSPAPV
ncbi:MAG: hypothetical protein ACTSX7_12870 [Alphaproteobacteria bacterium]